MKTVKFKEWNCKPVKAFYGNGRIAIQLIDAEDGEPIATATINIPDISAIDAVLNYEKHDYIFMCAKEDFSGYHNFSRTNAEHNVFAARYRNELNKRKIYR